VLLSTEETSVSADVVDGTSVARPNTAQTVEAAESAHLVE
jgi:hypothetical protein